MHADEGIEVVSYAQCTRCGGWVLEIVAAHTRGLCEDCVVEYGPDFSPIEVANLGRVTVYPTKKPNRIKGSKATARQAERARRHALRRLKNVFYDIYNIILAEERVKEGLPAWTVQRAARIGPDPGGYETIDFANVYAALDQAKVKIPT